MLTPGDFEAKQVMIVSKGEKLSFRNDNIVICDEEGKVLHQSTCWRLFAVFVIGYQSVTSGLIQRARKFGFSVIMLTPSFHPYHMIGDLAEGNVMLRRKQYGYEGIGAGRLLTANKMRNQHALLQSCRNKSPEQAAALSLMEGYINKLSEAEDIQGIMGLEGCASRAYFKAYFDNVPWQGRKPRIKFDMVNALLDIGYTALFNYVDAMLAVFGFDRYVGILHRQFYMRKSLTCDMVEPFRVLIDKQVKKGINLKQFKEEDFEVFDGKWCLKYKLSPVYASVFFNALMERKTELYLYIREFYRASLKGEQEEHMPAWEYK